MKKTRQNRIWKRVLAVMLVLTFAVALCGCVRYRAIGTVHDDGTITFYVLYATATSFDSSSQSLMTNQERQELENEGWTVRSYNGEPSDEYEYSGLVITKENIKLEDLHEEVSKVNFGNHSLEGLTCTKKGNLYSIDWDAEAIQNSTSQAGFDMGDLFDYGGFMEFVINLPCEPKSDNATKRSGGELTWDLSTIDESVHVEFELETAEKVAKKSKNKSDSKDSSNGIPAWVAWTIIGVVVAAATVVVVIVLIKNKGNGNHETSTVPPTPGMQQMPTVNQGYTPQSQYMPAQNAPAQPDPNPGMNYSQTTGLPSVDFMNSSNTNSDDHTRL